MTSPHTIEHRVSAERPALTRLLAIPAGEFAADHWGSDLLLSTAGQRGGEDFSDLFSLGAVDELVSRRGLRAPFLRAAKDGTTLPDRALTSGGGTGAGIGDQVNEDKILALFADGATIVLQGLHRTWDPLIGFSQQLAADLGHPVQVNAYITPPQNQGFADHYDVHDVFVLQVHGEKRWIIHDPVLRAPLRDQPWADRRDQVAAAAAHEPRLDTVLRPGDCLYLPRGFIHAAQALGGVTAHLTIGVQQWTRHHLAETLLGAATARLGDNEAVRRCLPLGVDVGDPGSIADDVEEARRALVEAIERLPATQLAETMRSRARDAQRAEPIAPLATLAAADDLDATTRVRLRRHLMLDRWELEDGQLQVRSRVGRFRMPAAYAPALDRLCLGREMQVAELDDHAETAVAAAALLVRAGVATVTG